MHCESELEAGAKQYFTELPDDRENLKPLFLTCNDFEESSCRFVPQRVHQNTEAIFQVAAANALEMEIISNNSGKSGTPIAPRQSRVVGLDSRGLSVLGREPARQPDQDQEMTHEQS